MGDQHTVGRRGVFEAARQVHGVADGGELTGRADPAEQDGAGVDPDPKMELARLVGSKPVHRPLELERSPNGELGVVFARRVRSPDRHQGVTDVLVDSTAVVGDHVVEP